MKSKFYQFATCCIAGMAMAANANSQTIETIAGSGGAGSSDASIATAATFNWPNQVALDVAGNMYITDRNNHSIRRVSSTGVVTTIAGTSAGFGGDGGPAGSGATKLSSPCGILVDPGGNILIADLNNARVRKISTSGTISTIVGGGLSTADGIMATAAALGNPVGMALDNSGNLYIATYSDNKVRKVTTAGVISTIAGTGTAGFAGDGGAATAAELSSPHGVAVDAAGNVYITDVDNHRIRKVNTSGVISTIAGTGTMGFSGDGGAATSAQLWAPYGIIVDAQNNIFFTDHVNNRVRRIDESGIISTVAGTGTHGFSGDGGLATAAAMKNSIGLAIDNGNNLIFVDAENNRVRRINAATATITGSNTVCVGGSTTYTSSLTGGAWTSSSAGTATVSSSGTVAGVAVGTATISYRGTLIAGAKIITVNPAPTAPTITASGATLSVPATYATYQWSVGGAPISGATNATHDATISGTYAVSVIDAGGCSAISADYIFSSVSVTTIVGDSRMVLAPNPATGGRFTVNVPSANAEDIALIVMNAVGEQIYETKIKGNAPQTIRIDVPAGIYIVRAVSASANYRTSVVIN